MKIHSGDGFSTLISASPASLMPTDVKPEPALVYGIFRLHIVDIANVTHNLFSFGGKCSVVVTSSRKFKIGNVRIYLTFNVHICVGDGCGNPRQIYRRKKISRLSRRLVTAIIIRPHLLPIIVGCASLRPRRRKQALRLFFAGLCIKCLFVLQVNRPFLLIFSNNRLLPLSSSPQGKYEAK